MYGKYIFILNYAFLLSQLFTSIAFLVQHQYRQSIESVLVISFYAKILFLEKLTPFRLTDYIRISLILILTNHTLVGKYFNAYDTSIYFDNFLHLFGTFSFSLFTYELVNTFIQISSSHPTITTFLLITLLGISLGTLFELLEFTSDILFNEYNQRGLLDTNLDLIFNLVGALAAATFIVIKDRK